MILVRRETEYPTIPRRSSEPYLKDITIQNIQGSRISSEYGCIIADIDKMPVENVFLSNINLKFEGGGKADMLKYYNLKVQ